VVRGKEVQKTIFLGGGEGYEGVCNIPSYPQQNIGLVGLNVHGMVVNFPHC